MSLPNSFRSFADFEREMIRPNFRIGLTLEEMVEDHTFEAELDFDADPFDADESF